MYGISLDSYRKINQLSANEGYYSGGFEDGYLDRIRDIRGRSRIR